MSGPCAAAGLAVTILWMKKKLLLIVMFWLLAGCAGGEETPQMVVSAPEATGTAVPTPLPSASVPAPDAPPPVLPSVSAPATAPPTAPPPTATAAAPDLLFPYTIAGLRTRDYPGGTIAVGELLQQNAAFRRYAISYPSDGLRITGQMHVPVGEGPFPAIVLLHGYAPRAGYQTGWGTEQAGAYFAGQGFLAIAPDLRSWGGSDSGPSLFHTGLVVDVINLISSLPSLAQADATRVGLWGHSMGGGLATKVLAVDERVGAAVLYAPNSADDADLIGRWGPGCLPGQSEEAGDHCNPAEVLPPDLDPDLLAAYFAAAADPVALRRVAPLYHLEGLAAPVQVHIGTGDGAALEQTPPEWSEKLAGRLQAQGRAVEYFTYPGEVHFFQGAAWEDLMARGLALFEASLRPSSEG